MQRRHFANCLRRIKSCLKNLLMRSAMGSKLQQAEGQLTWCSKSAWTRLRSCTCCSRSWESPLSLKMRSHLPVVLHHTSNRALPKERARAKARTNPRRRCHMSCWTVVVVQRRILVIQSVMDLILVHAPTRWQMVDVTVGFTCAHSRSVASTMLSSTALPRTNPVDYLLKVRVRSPVNCKVQHRHKLRITKVMSVHSNPKWSWMQSLPDTWQRRLFLLKFVVGVHCSVHVFRRQASILCQLTFKAINTGLLCMLLIWTCERNQLGIFWNTWFWHEDLFSSMLRLLAARHRERETCHSLMGTTGRLHLGLKNFPWGFHGSLAFLETNWILQMRFTSFLLPFASG